MLKFVGGIEMKDTVKFEKLDCNQLSKIVGGKRKNIILGIGVSKNLDVVFLLDWQVSIIYKKLI